MPSCGMFDYDDRYTAARARARVGRPARDRKVNRRQRQARKANR